MWSFSRPATGGATGVSRVVVVRPTPTDTRRVRVRHGSRRRRLLARETRRTVCKLPMTELMGFPPRWGFGPRFVRRHGRVARTAFCRWERNGSRRRTPAGLYPARRWPMERHVRTRSVRPAGSHHFNSRWSPTASPPRDVARAAARHPTPSSGRAYERPSQRASLARSECVLSYSLVPSNSSASVGNPALPIPAVAQYRVGFLPRLKSLVSALRFL